MVACGLADSLVSGNLHAQTCIRAIGNSFEGNVAMAKPPSVGIGCEAAPNGGVNLFLIDGEVKHGMEMPPEQVSGLIVALMATAEKAAELARQSPRVDPETRLTQFPYIVPSAIEVGGGEVPSLVVHVGFAKFAIVLGDCRALGQALIAASSGGA